MCRNLMGMGLLIALITLQPLQAADNRADHYEAALSQAKATGKDIVVFQRGSDWNKLGEILYHDIWLQDSFARKLGDGFVLVAVDRPELAGGPTLQMTGTMGISEPSTNLASRSRLVKLVDEHADLPPCELTAVTSEGKVPLHPAPRWCIPGEDDAESQP